MSYADSLPQAKSAVKQNTVLMQRALQQHSLMDALKYASQLLQQLRNPLLPPQRQYYELYVMVFDTLGELTLYLVQGHKRGRHHLADLYELVQYAGNVLPRLYLMITVGSALLQCNDETVPQAEILKDMIEMCKGVQNPTRGLFLRYFLSQMTKGLLESLMDLPFSITFLTTNFVEMNKLWVRLQYQGPLKERDLRTKERKELQILVGSQLLRLSQVIESEEADQEENFTVYCEKILPGILEQMVQSRDVICQEYLFDIVCQVFPDNYHLETVEQLLQATAQMNPQVSLHKIIATLVQRLIDYVEREAAPGKQGGRSLFDIFWQYLEKLGDERPDIALVEVLDLVSNVITLNNCCDPENTDNLNKLYSLLFTKCKDFAVNDEATEDTVQQQQLFVELMTFKEVKRANLIVVNCPKYTELLLSIHPRAQLQAIESLLNLFLDQSDDWVVETEDQFMKLLALCKPATALISKEGQETVPLVQQTVAKWCHALVRATTKSRQLRPITKQVQLLLSLKNALHEGTSQSVSCTYESLITLWWQLIKKCDFLRSRLPKNKSSYDTSIKQIFKYVSRCITELFNVVGPSITDRVFKLNLQTASIADQLSLPEISYDFFTQALTVFEDTLSDSRTQFQAIVYMTQILQRTRSLRTEGEDYYDNLIVRTTLHASKLLKKQDQCRAVYLCSHLWWATEIESLGETEDDAETEGQFYREGKRLLECLQRSLRSADSIMDNMQSCELMVEILNRCLYFLIYGEEAQTRVSVNYVNGLIELIKTNLNSLHLEQMAELKLDDTSSTKTPQRVLMGQDGSVLKVSKSNGAVSVVLPTAASTESVAELATIPADHFQRTCAYILQQAALDDRFKAITV
ncbi:retromer subunit VPS35 KNAG_0C01130 [Huiozyma naganishii CBS 8797]|uniref:Vacuolar protein sorting-associated protein 35 n=1 Tax=Huiozyma naganishii (strain ATCC MYA-139 / BCRC 22969 / CBS 8797 / KCTC 17520 / NBRC 10181 / NCYC 3082 / Yp74L-3) TaxID=1071383 RepID=J7S5L5_HUIN7|nr:hypothetical protein KNAG_0C01130 [Kazachstania naganishii CBS 8797]CCK69226.1 hypothetical protein KNAG_0C01130 [Kazachstania naganishii CBS 8797]